MIKKLLILLVFMTANSLWAASWFMTPAGSDANSGADCSHAWKTFRKAQTTMAAADTLNLCDGTYSVANGNGVMDSFKATPSGVPPSGTSVGAMTIVQAVNFGSAFVSGDGATFPGLVLGTGSTKVSFLKIMGIIFTNGLGNTTENTGLYNTDHIYIKNCGFESHAQTAGSILSIGQNDNDQGNTFFLIEDVFIWGIERAGAIAYRSDHGIFRRVIIREDGCTRNDGIGCNSSGNASLGITVYNSSNISVQNVMVIDNLIGPTGGPFAGDFSIAWHLSADGSFTHHTYGQNEWLGDISLNSVIAGFQQDFGSDNISTPAALQPVATFTNDVAWNAPVKAYDFENGCSSSCQPRNFVVNNITGTSAGTGGAIFNMEPGFSSAASGSTSTLQNMVFRGTSTGAGVSSSWASSGVDLFATSAFPSGNYSSQACSSLCKTTDPEADTGPSIKYPIRIEAGSTLKGAGVSSADIGANIINTYGVDGTFYGDTNFDTLSGTVLWPWPNEAIIKTNMCASISRGFCSDSSITHYVMNSLGNGNPYAAASGTGSTVGGSIFKGSVMTEVRLPEQQDSRIPGEFDFYDYFNTYY